MVVWVGDGVLACKGCEFVRGNSGMGLQSCFYHFLYFELDIGNGK